MTDDLVSGIRHEPWPLLTTVVAVWGVVALVSLGVALGEGDGPRLEMIPWDHLVAVELLSLTTWVVLSLPGLALLRQLWTPPRHPILSLVAAALVGLVFSLIFNALERQVVVSLVTTPAQETFAARILPDLDARIVGFLAMVALVRVTPALAGEDRRRAAAEGKPPTAGVPPLVTQLQSHFLFNTLNDAAELVHVDPDAADDVITRLSEFLGAALLHTRHEAIREHEPDLAFLDIQMPGLDGFGVVRALESERPPAVVFVTAHDHYAVRAFDVHALDYLLKPFDQERLQTALDRARTRLATGQPADSTQRMLALLQELNQRQRGELGLERLVVRSQERSFFLRTDAIDWIEAAGKYVHLHVGKATHLLRGSMAGLEQQLDPARFVRISRSAIINIDRIQEVQPWFQGDHVVILQDRTRLTSTRGYRENLQRLLGK
jgi:two-component system LytT family response regulator